jgi:phosphate:Na+ symporter
MLILSFFIKLAGALALLLFSVRLIRTGIVRAYEVQLNKMIKSAGSPAIAVVIGIGLAVLLQSSLATVFFLSGLMASSSLAPILGLGILFGADLGSALVVYFLNLDISFLTPFFLTVGGYLFLRDTTVFQKHIGRILIGLALVFVSLDFIREAVDPIQGSGFLLSIVTLLERDFLTAFLIGAAIALVMHSSVAAILTFIAMASAGAISEAVGISLMLGANLGSAMLAIWLTKVSSTDVRRVVFGNALVRGVAAMVWVVTLNTWSTGWLTSISSSSQSIIVGHLVFNLSLLLCVPFCGAILRAVSILIPDDKGRGHELLTMPLIMNDVVRRNPAVGLVTIQREIARMVDMVEQMLGPVMPLFVAKNTALIDDIRALDKRLNHSLDSIRAYASALSQLKLASSDKKQLGYLLEFASVIEASGDVISKQILPLAEEKNKIAARFSEPGYREITDMHHHVASSVPLIANLLLTRSLGVASSLVERKREFDNLYRKSRKKHLKRLAEGNLESFATSDIHLDACLAFKELNGRLSSLAHPVINTSAELKSLPFDKNATLQFG